MAQFEKVLVAHKRTTFEKYTSADDPALHALIEAGDIAVGALEASHDAHYRSLDEVLRVLRESGVNFESKYRGDVDTIEHDLVVSVGGDGMVLDLSHKLSSQPILAVNSDPAMSVGYFCAGDAAEFGELFERTQTGAWTPISLYRFGVNIDGERVGCPILNDILVAHENPAAVTSYVITVGEADPEPQKSSGIWISTPAGSTAAIRSAGGYVLPLDSTRIQYLVREPCPPTVGLYRHIKGIRRMSAGFEVTSKMPQGRVYLDGPHLFAEFGVGRVLTLDDNVPPLRIFGIQDKIRD